MYFAKYLLSIEEIMNSKNMNTEKEKALLERAFSCVDETRRGKAERMQPGRARAACLGAGLLLQLAVGEALGKTGDEKNKRKEAIFSTDVEKSEISKYSVSQLLAGMAEMPHFSLSYTYGEKGKPYFKELPFYFSLSHSGDYVLCGLSDVEVGADIQQHCGRDVRKLAQRFFSEREAAILEKAGEEREKLFYRLWARKEAYGKLTGKGIAEALDMDLLPVNGGILEREREDFYGDRGKAIPQTTALPEGGRLIWDEYDGIEGYSIAFCIENSD